MSHVDPMTATERIPKTCTVTDVCRALNISPSQFYDLRKSGRFPIAEILPRIGRGPRFRGVDVQLYLDGEMAVRAARGPVLVRGARP